jgi:hypothetical protein
MKAALSGAAFYHFTISRSFDADHFFKEKFWINERRLLQEPPGFKKVYRFS